MPRSRIRRKADFTPPPRRERGGIGVAGRWVAPTMVTLFVVGLAWIVVYYVTQSGDGVPVMEGLGGWNLIIGMGLITGGFITATRWK